MKSVTLFIHQKLKLVTNHYKSKVAKDNHAKFLGITIIQAQRTYTPWDTQGDNTVILSMFYWLFWHDLLSCSN